MKLVWNLDDNTVTPALPTLKRGDTIELDIEIQRNGAPIFLSPGFALQFGAKLADALGGDALVLASAFTYLPEEKVFRGEVNCETDELNAAMGIGATEISEPLEAVGEITFAKASALTKWTTSPAFTVKFELDVIRGAEGTPISSADPNDYYTKTQADARYQQLQAPGDAWAFLQTLGFDYDAARGGFTLIMPLGGAAFIPATLVPNP